MSETIPKDWMRTRLTRLNTLRHKLLASGFHSEIVDMNDGTEEFLIKNIADTTYVMSIHHTFVDWHFKSIFINRAIPMYETNFLKVVDDNNFLLQTLGNLGQEHEEEPNNDKKIEKVVKHVWTKLYHLPDSYQCTRCNKTIHEHPYMGTNKEDQTPCIIK